MQPAVDERLGGRLGLVPVARDDVRPADQQLADARLRVGLVERRGRRPARRSRRSRRARPPTRAGRNVAIEEVSVRPKPLPTRAFGNASWIALDEARARSARRRRRPSARARRRRRRSPAGASPASRSPARVVSRSMRSSTIASQERADLEGGHDHRRAAAASSVTSSWLLQPVTWNSGTEIEVAHARAVARSMPMHAERGLACWTGSSRGWSSRPSGSRSCRSCRRSPRGRRGRGRRRRAARRRAAARRARSTTSAPESATTYSTSALGEAGVHRHGDRAGQLRRRRTRAPSRRRCAQPDRHAVAALDAARRAARRPPGPRGPTAAGRSAARRRPRRAPRRRGRASTVARSIATSDVGQAGVAGDAPVVADDAGRGERGVAAGQRIHASIVVRVTSVGKS